MSKASISHGGWAGGRSYFYQLGDKAATPGSPLDPNSLSGWPARLSPPSGAHHLPASSSETW